MYVDLCDLVNNQVEHIIRDDYLVEAMEVIELYCDLLLARFGMLEQMMYCEDSLAESVATLIWVAPRLSADVQELNQVGYFNHDIVPVDHTSLYVWAYLHTCVYDTCTCMFGIFNSIGCSSARK